MNCIVLQDLVRRKIISKAVVGQVSIKLSELTNPYPALAKMYELVIRSSQINMPPTELKDPYYESTPLKIDTKTALKRVAYREDNIISFNSGLFSKFDDPNQSATLVHEWTSNVLGEYNDSVNTRNVIGSLFSQGGSKQVIESILAKFGFGFVLNPSRDQGYRLQCNGCIKFVDERMSVSISGRKSDKYTQLHQDPLPFSEMEVRPHDDDNEKITKGVRKSCFEAVTRRLPETDSDYSIDELVLTKIEYLFRANGGITPIQYNLFIPISVPGVYRNANDLQSLVEDCTQGVHRAARQMVLRYRALI